jgi:methenyltetrahydromethanopterin cyclohydrolase
MRDFPRVRSGDRLTPRLLNLIFRELERWNRLKVANGSITQGESPVITCGVGGAGGGVWCRSPGGGIAAISGTTPGSATCTLYTWDGTSFSLGSDEITVKNPYAAAVGASKKVWAVKWQGDYWAANWEC